MKEKSLWSSSTAKASQGGGKGLLISKDLTFTLSGLRQYLMTYEDGVHTDRQEERMQGSNRGGYRERRRPDVFPDGEHGRTF